jgi:PAS domain S-box-containing protein
MLIQLVDHDDKNNSFHIIRFTKKRKYLTIKSYIFFVFFLFVLLFPNIGHAASDSLTSEERKWLNAHKNSLIVNHTAVWPPMLFTDKNGQPAGIALDYYRLVEKKLDFKFKIYSNNDWTEVLSKFKEHKIDVICDIMKSSERSEIFLFTQPYIEIPNVIVVRSNVQEDLSLSDMRGMRIAVIDEDIVHEHLIKQYPFLDIVPYGNRKDCLLGVSTGAVDAAIVSIATASYISQEAGITNLRIAGYSEHQTRLSLGSRKDLPILNKILGKGLSLITQEEKDTIYQRWINLKLPLPFYKNRYFWFSFLGGAGVIIGIISLILIWNRKLKREVEKRTASLEKQTNALKKEIQIRKQAEQSLIRNRERLESILSNIQGLTYRCRLDEDWTMTFMSPHAEVLTGYPVADFIENKVRTYESIIHKGDTQEVLQTVHRAVGLSEPWELEYRIHHKDGSIQWVFEKGAAVVDRDGAIEYLDGFIIDITKQKIMEEHFRQAQKMEAIGSLAGGIAHDFNNILGGILGFSELLKEDLASIGCSEKVRKRVDYILKAGLRAKGLVAQILAFSRPELDRFESVNVSIIAKETVKLLSATLPSTIQIKTAYHSKSSVLADVTKLHQIIMNLCTNAGHAMKEKGGILSVAINDVHCDSTAVKDKEGAVPGTFLCLGVEDTGHGMDEKTRSKIMDPFFTTKTKGEGTGMGLWVVQGIVRDMGGFIEVTSKPGYGSRFDVYIPVVSEPILPADETRTLDEESITGNESILLIDDEKTLTQLAKEILEYRGYRVTVFNSPVKALDFFKDSPENFDLVITDLTMPELTGDSLCRKIKAVLPGIPVILTTGLLEDSDIGELFDAVLKKPVKINDMAKAIRDILNRNKLNNQGKINGIHSDHR